MKRFLPAFLLVLLVVGLIVTKSKILGTKDEEVEVILTGDVMLGRTVMTKSLDIGDPAYPFRKVADALRNADLVFVNLENPIVTGCPKHTTGLIFCTDPKMAEGLAYAGVDVVTLANNHSRNYGEKGLAETKSILSGKGILHTDSNLVIKEVNGLTFGFLGFDMIDRNITQKQLYLAKTSDKQVDILIVGIHWGVEYKGLANVSQRQIAKSLVESGADVVVGHHPHWVQDMEYINSRPVYYSLGNFVFDQMWSTKTREGLAIRLTFNGKGEIVREEKLPIFMTSWAQPEWVNK